VEPVDVRLVIGSFGTNRELGPTERDETLATTAKV